MSIESDKHAGEIGYCTRQTCVGCHCDDSQRELRVCPTCAERNATYDAFSRKLADDAFGPDDSVRFVIRLKQP